MIRTISIPPLRLRRAGAVKPMIVLRIALAAAVVCFAIAPALSAETLRLRSEVTVAADVLTLADLTEGAPANVADTPLFRSPALGETGTIQARRVAEAAGRLGLTLEFRGRAQVAVERAARRIGTSEIESAVKQALEAQHGLDQRAVTLAFDASTAPALVVAPNATGPVLADHLSYDRRTRRLSATIKVGDGNSLRIAGTATETVEVTVLNRALNRGETVQSSDVSIERRMKDHVASDAQPESNAVIGRVARRNLAAGSLIRTGDLGKPELIARGDNVTVVYETAGMTLTLRARASEGGGLGDVVAIVNQQSKKTLQATVVGAGKVSVNAAAPSRVAINTTSPSTIER